MVDAPRGWVGPHTPEPYSVRLAFSAQIERYCGAFYLSSPAAMRGKAIIATDATVDKRSSAVRGEEASNRAARGPVASA